MSIVIGADLVPTKGNNDLFKKGDVAALVGEDLLGILDAADYRVFNLETPLFDGMSPIDKCGPVLCAEPSSIVGLKKIGVDLFTLANNHIMDHGFAGLTSTLKLLDENKINHLGAGENIERAQESFVTSVNEKNFGFYACVEHEFSIADSNIPGANPFDALESFDCIAELRKKCDFVVVLYHGGKEYFQYPSPMLQKICRKFVQKGADLVICQHSHCIGCSEKYENGSILYGQGNFLFGDCDTPIEQTSLLVKISDELQIEYIPLVKTECGVQLAKGKVADEILSAFNKRNNQIKQNGFIEKSYKIFAEKMLNGYMLACSGFSHKLFLRILNKLSGRKMARCIVNSYKKKELLAIRNFIECESHRELFIEGLKNR